MSDQTLKERKLPEAKAEGRSDKLVMRTSRDTFIAVLIPANGAVVSRSDTLHLGAWCECCACISFTR